MATKTFKIGESCAGGVITVQTGTAKVAVIQKEFNTFNEISRLEVSSDDEGSLSKIREYLWDMTSDFYTEKVLSHIKSKVKFKKTWLD